MVQGFGGQGLGAAGVMGTSEFSLLRGMKYYNFFWFVYTLIAGPRSSLSLKLSDTRVYEPEIQILRLHQKASLHLPKHTNTHCSIVFLKRPFCCKIQQNVPLKQQNKTTHTASSSTDTNTQRLTQSKAHRLSFNAHQHATLDAPENAPLELRCTPTRNSKLQRLTHSKPHRLSHSIAHRLNQL